MSLRDLYNHTRAEIARRLAAEQAVLIDSPQEILAPRRSGWCRIIDAGDADKAEYGITEQWWDPSANEGEGGWVDAASPPGLVDAVAREAGGRTGGTTDTYCYFWHARRKDGVLEPLIELPAARLIWAEAKQNWSQVTGGATWDDWRVKCYPLGGDAPGGDPDTESEVTVHFPYKPTGHPNVVDGDLLAYVTVGGTNWCLTPYLDARIQTIRMWSGTTGDIPDGWQLCDGGYDPQGSPVPDLRGRFVVGYDSGDSDYDAIGKTGGNKTQNLTHTQHRHTLQQCIYGVSPGDTAVAYQAYTGYETQGPHSNVDMRPPFYTLAYVIRVDNSVAWS